MTCPKPGDKIRTEDGSKEFVIDSLIHTGSGQGDIYKVHNDKDVYALKLFHTGDYKKLRSQIERLQKRGRASSAFVHPLYVVRTDDRIGYVMEYVAGEHYKDASILFNGVETAMADGSVVRLELPFHQKLAILDSIIRALMIPFGADIVIADVKFENIKVNVNDFSVKILDTDTAVGGGKRPMVSGTVGFMEPLVMRGEKIPDKYSDAYSLAVMIWMTLISGHPLRGRRYYEPCNQNVDTYTFATNPVYVYHRKDASNRPSDSDKRVIERMKKYPKYFLDAMHKTFVDGLFEGEKRVEPREWLEIIERLYEDHFICKYCGEEHFFCSVERVCHICGTPLEPPIKLVCVGSGLPGVHLFNGAEVWSTDVMDEQAGYQLFAVVVSDYDKKYGLRCTGSQTVTLELKNGIVRDFERGDVIPIFLDAKMRVGKYTLQYVGGKTK